MYWAFYSTRIARRHIFYRFKNHRKGRFLLFFGPLYRHFTRMETAAPQPFTPPARHQDAWRQRDYYKFWAPEAVRFADLDPLGHVNNNSYGVYVEGARVALLHHVIPDFWQQPIGTVLRAIHVEYHAELRYPAKIDLGVRIAHMGNSSVNTIVGIFTGDTCHATAISTGVIVDRKLMKPVPVPDELRALFAPYC